MTRIRRGRAQRAAQQPSAPVAPAGLPGGSYRPLQDADLLRIVDAAQEVFERTGIQVAASPCREVCRAAGRRIYHEADRVSDRTSAVWGRTVLVRLGLGCCRPIQ